MTTMSDRQTITQTENRVAEDDLPRDPPREKLDAHAAAYRLRLQGYGEAEIPDLLTLAGCETLTQDEVHAAVEAAARRVRETHAEDTAVALELARLDAMLQGLWPAASTGDTAAVDRVLRIGERRDKLLGLATEAARQAFLQGASDHDLSGMSVEELQLLEKIQEKLAQKKSAIGSRGTRGGRPTRKGGGS